MNDLVLSTNSKYIFDQSHSELKAKADASLGIVNRSTRENGIQSGFFSLLDLVVKEASAGHNIVSEFPGFFRAMMDDEQLFNTFKEKLNSLSA